MVEARESSVADTQLPELSGVRLFRQTLGNFRKKITKYFNLKSQLHFN